MPASPIRYSAACPSTSNTNFVASLGGDQTFPVNFSGKTDTNGNPSTFTVGGWVRLMSIGTAGTIFNFNRQLWITIDASGICTLALGNWVVLSDVAITDTYWHYVAVTYLPSLEPNQTGMLTLYLDGIEVGGEEVNVNLFELVPGCYLGPNGAQFEFAAWTIWSEALDLDVIGAPQWGDPAKGTEGADGLVAAFNFAEGSAEDISGHRYPVTVAAQCWHTICMELNSGVATLPASDTVNPGGAASSGIPDPFSILGWACVPSPQASTNYPLLTNSGPTVDASSPLVLQLAADSSGKLSAGYSWFQSVNSTPVAADEWFHLALTWDGNDTLTFYLNGLEVTTQQISPSPITSPDVSIGAQDSVGPWYMQALSIWSTCLDQGSIDSYLQGADPTEQPGCVANFDLSTDLGDSINDNSLVVNAVNACQITEMITPVSSADQATTPVVVRQPIPLEGPRLLMHSDLKRIAKANGIDVDSPLSSAEMEGDDYAEIAAWFDGVAAKVPPQGAARLKTEFLRNLRIGTELRQRGIKAGTFSVTTEGNDTVGHYHTEAGPVEVYRLPGVALTQMQKWGLQIAFDVVSLVASAFGVLTSAAAVTKAVGLLEPEINALVSAIQSVRSKSSGLSNLMISKDTALAVWNFINGANLLFSVLKRIVTGSWWSVPFTIANFAAWVVLFFATDGAALILRLIQMAVQLSLLVGDLLHMPKSDAGAASTAAAGLPANT